MRIHLIKSREVDPELFTKVFDLLEALPGPMNFTCESASLVDFSEDELFTRHIPSLDKFERMAELKSEVSVNYSRVFPMEREVASWETLFSKCDRFRKKHRIPGDQFVILITDVANDKNWFASLDQQMPYNGFVHSADWDHYIECNAAFPVAYEVLALVLQKHIFEGYNDLRQMVHANPIGCISDLCTQKKEIILKLRTADICKNCMEKLKQKLPMPVVHHALALMESLRVKMLYAQNFRQDSRLSRLVIDNRKRILLPEFGNIEIKLRPLEKALYFLFLQYPEGIYISSLADHRAALLDIYSALSNTGTMDDMRARIVDLTNALDNSASEKISRIKRCFEEALGDDLAKPYYIQGGNGEKKKISLDRNLFINQLHMI